MKYVLSYTSAPDAREKAPLHFADHRARWQKFVDGGKLIMIGPFSDIADGAMAIFRTRDAAEEFAASDPFVLHGVVSDWKILEWNEALVH